MNKKSLKAPIEEASESALFCVVLFFFSRMPLNWNVWFLLVSFSKLRFLFVCFNTMKSNIVNVYLGCRYTWIWIIVHWRFKLRWIFKAECYLLYSFGGVWTRCFNLWCNLQDSAWKKSTHPEQLSSRVLNVRLVHMSFSQNCFFFL